MQKYAARVKIFATQEFRIPEKSRKNPGRIPEKQTNIAEQSWKTTESIGRIPEESRKNKQDRRTIPEESRKTIESIRRIPEESRKNFRIPEKSRNIDRKNKQT